MTQIVRYDITIIGGPTYVARGRPSADAFKKAPSASPRARFDPQWHLLGGRERQFAPSYSENRTRSNGSENENGSVFACVHLGMVNSDNDNCDGKTSCGSTGT